MAPPAAVRVRGARAGRNLADASPVRVERIAVFRALQLGDLLCAVPALRALRRGFPDARITLIGLASAADFVRRFRAYLDDWIEFPGAAALPEQPVRAGSLPAFFARARARRFDLALQMHGSGEQTNAIVRMLGARRYCGFTPAHLRPEGEGCVLWPIEGHEITRLLQLTDRLGLARAGLHLELPIDDPERRRWQHLVRERAIDARRLVIVHPGARRASRRWPGVRYAELCDRLCARGWQVAITGTHDERALVSSVIGAMRSSAIDLCGATTLGELAAAIGSCRLLVCNDTGVSHVAAALGTASVVVACGSELERWRPLDRVRHQAVAIDLPCRPCAHEACPYEGHPCASAIPVERVFDLAMQQLHGATALGHA